MFKFFKKKHLKKSKLENISIMFISDISWPKMRLLILMQELNIMIKFILIHKCTY